MKRLHPIALVTLCISIVFSNVPAYAAETAQENTAAEVMAAEQDIAGENVEDEAPQNAEDTDETGTMQGAEIIDETEDVTAAEATNETTEDTAETTEDAVTTDAAAAEETAALAESVPDNGGVYFVPAFVGLGTPYWVPDARGTITGLTRGTGRAHIIRAALEAIAYQTADVLDAMEQDTGKLGVIKVDGGAAQNDFLMEFQADILARSVIRPSNVESTALGAAFLAGLGCGFWGSTEELSGLCENFREFSPSMTEDKRTELLSGWSRAINATVKGYAR